MNVSTEYFTSELKTPTRSFFGFKSDEEPLDTIMPKSEVDNYIEKTISSAPEEPKKPVVKKKDVSPLAKARELIGTQRMVIEYPTVYPISAEFQGSYHNYNNLISNGTIDKINETLDLAKEKANEKSHTIIFNKSLQPSKILILNDDEINMYSNYFVDAMNSVSVLAKTYTLKEATPVQKEQSENQVKLNFKMEVTYNYPEDTSKDFNIMLNVVVLFEKMFQDEDRFFDTKISQPKQTYIYLDTLKLMGLGESKFLPGNYTKLKD